MLKNKFSSITAIVANSAILISLTGCFGGADPAATVAAISTPTPTATPAVPVQDAALETGTWSYLNKNGGMTYMTFSGGTATIRDEMPLGGADGSLWAKNTYTYDVQDDVAMANGFHATQLLMTTTKIEVMAEVTSGMNLLNSFFTNSLCNLVTPGAYKELTGLTCAAPSGDFDNVPAGTPYYWLYTINGSNIYTDLDADAFPTSIRACDSSQDIMTNDTIPSSSPEAGWCVP